LDKSSRWLSPPARRTGLVVVLAAAAGCRASVAEDPPGFVRAMIEDFEAAPAGTAPRAIWRYTYDGEPVYYVPFSDICCDRMSRVYDRSGDIVCAPDGGLTGAGDGRCQYFFAVAADGVRVWSKDQSNVLSSGGATP
jgi:Domain of unknown function (DUF6970)